jgi:hypothetical protein
MVKNIFIFHHNDLKEAKEHLQQALPNHHQVGPSSQSKMLLKILDKAVVQMNTKKIKLKPGIFQ